MAGDLPRNGKLLGLAARFKSDQALADHLKVPRETLRDHINRLGLREAVKIAREASEEARPDELPIFFRDYSGEDVHYVYPLGDVHLGAKMHDAEKWARWLGYFEERQSVSMLGTGDFLNTAIIGSKSDVYEEKLTVGEAKRKLRDQLTPFADRIDLMMPGNHEERVTRQTGDCPIQDVSDWLKVNYARSAALIVYTVGDQEYEVYVRHGTGNGQSVAGLRKSAGVVRADIYITGHTHQQVIARDDWFVRVRDRMTRRERVFVVAGSFLGYEPYAAERGYVPTTKGAPRIRLDGRGFDIRATS